VATVDVAGATLHVVEVDEAGLVQVGQAATLSLVGLELAVESGKLGGKELVVGNRRGGCDGGLPGDQQVRVQQRGAHLLEHEGIQRIRGSATARWAAWSR
jgi:hypothetical protein